MSFTRPTLAALVTRIRADFHGRLDSFGALLRRALVEVLAVVWAGAVHMLHGHLEWLGKQIFADLSERTYLLRQAAMYGLSPTAATYASGTVTATGENGSAIDTDAVLVSTDGVRYEVTATATIAAGEAAVSIRAIEAGDAGNIDAAATLSFESPVVGVDADATVDVGGIAGGFDEEDTEELRDRLLLRLREPPQGGNEQDYLAWTLAVAGVTRAWVFPNEDGLGTVVVRFVCDDLVDIFPEAAVVTSVQTAIDAERPITAEVTVEAPTALEVDFDIWITPEAGQDEATVQAAVEAELADLFRREAEPGDGAGSGTILLSHLRTAIGVAEGVDDFALLSPGADVEPGTGQLPVLGTVTWGTS